MIDPQLQAIHWICRHEADRNLNVVQLTQHEYMLEKDTALSVEGGRREAERRQRCDKSGVQKFDV